MFLPLTLLCIKNKNKIKKKKKTIRRSSRSWAGGCFALLEFCSWRTEKCLYFRRWFSYISIWILINMVRNIIEEVRPLLNNFKHFEFFVVKREVNMENHTVARRAKFVTNLIVWMDEALSNNNLSLMQLQ